MKVLVTQLLVMKGKEAPLAEIEQGEHKGDSEGSKGKKLGNSVNDNTFSSSSSIPLKLKQSLKYQCLMVKLMLKF